MSFASVSSVGSVLRGGGSANGARVFPVEDDDIEMQLEHQDYPLVELRQPEIHITPKAEQQLLTIENYVLSDYITYEEHDFLAPLDPHNVPRFVMFERSEGRFDVLPESTFRTIPSDQNGFKVHPITRQTIAESAVYRQSGVCELSFVRDARIPPRSAVNRPLALPARTLRQFGEEGVTAIRFFEESNFETGLRFLSCLDRVRGRSSSVSVSLSDLGQLIKQEVVNEAKKDVGSMAGALVGVGVVAAQLVGNINFFLLPSGALLTIANASRYMMSKNRGDLLPEIPEGRVTMAFKMLYGSIKSTPLETLYFYKMS